MITRWGANIEKDKVLLGYPRPKMLRNSYINLNGMWQYAIVRGESLPDKIDGETGAIFAGVLTVRRPPHRRS